MNSRKSLTTLTCACVFLIAAIAVGAQTQGAPTQGAAPGQSATAAEQHMAAIKKNLAASQQNLQQYQWTETRVVSYKGEAKSTTTSSCSYGQDGNVVKTVTSTPEEHEKHGLKGKVAKHKMDDMEAYMQSAVALVKTYIPPDPSKIQACKEAGKMAMTVIEPNKKVKIDFKDYEKPGDDLAIELDVTTNQILAVTVASYLADVKDAVNLNVAMATLPDGTGYPATIKLDTPAKELGVVLTNSGYTKKAN